MDVEQLRKSIPATQILTYMNTGWSGPSPKPVVDAVSSWIAYESYEGPTSRPVLEKRMELTKGVRATIARFMGATPEEICLTQNTTEGINIVTSGLGWKVGDEVVTCTLEHSSVLIPCYFLGHRDSVGVRVVQLNVGDDKDTMLTKLEDAITERTRLVCFSHIAYCTGIRLPAKEIHELAHRKGALVLVDGAQSAGAVPIDVRGIEADFYAIPAHKWVLGPDGAGALFIRSDLIPMVEPVRVAWAAAKSHDLQGNMEPNVAAIRKYELTTSSGALLNGFATALDFLGDIGMDEIDKRSLSLAAYCKQQLLGIAGVSLNTPLEVSLSSGLVNFAVEGIDPRLMTNYLWEEHKVVARPVSWPLGTRLSLDFFNTVEEIDLVVEAVRRAIDKGIPDRVTRPARTGSDA